MVRRVFLLAGWLLPWVFLLLFLIKGRQYDPAYFTPPASEAAVLPVPAVTGAWILEGSVMLPADRMFEKINGKADYYLQYGADELCCGEWVQNDSRWDMYLYRFSTAQGALGAFNGERPSDGGPIEGITGYTVPGQVAIAVGTYYLQLGAQTAGADPAPAVELARALAPHLGGSESNVGPQSELDLKSLAGKNLVPDTDGYLPENAFGFASLANVQTVEVDLESATAVWFRLDGDDGTVAAFAEELALYGGEELFAENGASGGSMFGSWCAAGVLDGAVWGVQNAGSREALLRHWNTLRERHTAGSEAP